MLLLVSSSVPAQTLFVKYYDTVMPLLLSILVNANDKVCAMLAQQASILRDQESSLCWLSHACCLLHASASGPLHIWRRVACISPMCPIVCTPMRVMRPHAAHTALSRSSGATARVARL